MRHVVLAYHAVSASWRSPLAISQTTLEAQLSVLSSRGYVGLTLSEWERRRSSRSLPARSVVVTFDDGYRSTLLARPVLDAYGYKGTVFPVVGFVESREPLVWEGIDHWRGTVHERELESLSWDDLEELQANGWEVGSHTVSHPDLTTLDGSDVARELAKSRAAISDRLGECMTLAYPYGRASPAVADEAAEAGYLAACTLTRCHRIDDCYRRPRVGLYAADTGLRLRAKVSPTVLRLRRHRLAAKILGEE